MTETIKLTAELASELGGLALKGIKQEYPNSPAYSLNGPGDLKSPRAVHPAFYGCYDWHSSVHSHWMLVYLLRTLPDPPKAHEIRAALGENLTAENLLVETAYIKQPNRQSFERMYGWAWLLKLSEELRGWDDPDGKEWARNLQPLADAFVERYLDFLPRQTYPIRAGTHSNTAFGMTFALDYARATTNSELENLIVQRSLAYFSEDKDYPASWEPAGNDFLSPCLAEADLMRRVLPPGEFRKWIAGFLPGLDKGEPENLFTPATVSDRTDPQIVHLDGLNLSRAWCMLGMLGVFTPGDAAHRVLEESADRHAQAALPYITSGDYMGEHWLASFAVYLLSVANA